MGTMAAEHQAQPSVGSNITWFRENPSYIRLQGTLECYRNIRRCLEHELRGQAAVLDVGNGGFFNYDTTLAGSVTAVDLFLADGPGPLANTTFRRGSLLALPFDDRSFDCVVVQNVLHHVTGRTVADNRDKMRRGLQEIYRCLRPGGKAVLIESTVSPFFYRIESLVFPAAHRLTIGGHPMTFQFTPEHIIRSSEACGFSTEEFIYVPRGRYVLQFGYRWPSVLTPARPIKLVLRRGQ
jgi:SAM-dependent methyltransferase